MERSKFLVLLIVSCIVGMPLQAGEDDQIRAMFGFLDTPDAADFTHLQEGAPAIDLEDDFVVIGDFDPAVEDFVAIDEEGEEVPQKGKGVRWSPEVREINETTGGDLRRSKTHRNRHKRDLSPEEIEGLRRDPETALEQARLRASADEEGIRAFVDNLSRDPRMPHFSREIREEFFPKPKVEQSFYVPKAERMPQGLQLRPRVRRERFKQTFDGFIEE